VKATIEPTFRIRPAHRAFIAGTTSRQSSAAAMQLTMTIPWISVNACSSKFDTFAKPAQLTKTTIRNVEPTFASNSLAPPARRGLRDRLVLGLPLGVATGEIFGEALERLSTPQVSTCQ